MGALAIAEIGMEILGYLPQAIKVGVDVTASAQKAWELWQKGPATTQDELDALKAQITEEKATLDRMTAELDTDPT